MTFSAIEIIRTKPSKSFAYMIFLVIFARQTKIIIVDRSQELSRIDAAEKPMANG